MHLLKPLGDYSTSRQSSDLFIILAQQVTAILRQRILDRLYSRDHRLPSESELAQELGVSQATIYNKDNHPLVFGLSYYDDRLLRLRLVQASG